MRRLRSVTGWVAVLGVVALAGLAWVAILATERDALRASEDGARQAAAGAAIAIEQATQAGVAVEDIAALAAGAGPARLVVRDAGGALVAGAATDRPTVGVRLSTGGTVAAEIVLTSDRLRVGRYGKAILLSALVLLGCSLVALANLARDRRKAHDEVTRLARKFDEVAVVDELTGFGNRARLLGDLGTLVARGHRYGSQVGLAVFSVDGLDTSDAKISQVATLLQGQARAADACFRLASNRIAVVLVEQGELGAALAAERIRSAVVLSGLCTVSAGVTALGRGERADAADLVARGEAAVADAAAAGGNCVVGSFVLDPIAV